MSPWKKLIPHTTSPGPLNYKTKLHFDGADHLVIFVPYKDKNHFVKEDDLFDINPMTGQVGAFKGEQQFTSALLSLIEGKASKVYFTEGHGEHSLQDTQSQNGYGLLEASLKGENMETSNLNLATRVKCRPMQMRWSLPAPPSLFLSSRPRPWKNISMAMASC